MKSVFVFVMLTLMTGMVNSQVESGVRIEKYVPLSELASKPSTITFSLFATNDDPQPILSETFEAGAWEWKASSNGNTVAAWLFDATPLGAESSFWYELEADGQRIGEREQFQAPDANNPDISVEGYIETRAGGIKFSDQSIQSTAVDASALQQRVTGSCVAGSSIASINADGTVQCEVDNDSGGDITSITAGNGLSGGGSSGDVTIDADTTVIQSRVTGTCPSGQSIRTVNQNGSVVCETIDSGATPPLCSGTNQALQWDGNQFNCVDIRALGASAGTANGFELTDTQQETWDGFQRTPKTWAEAKAACESLGGRLPIITELYRNNTSNGSSNLSDPSSTSYLWTLIAGANGKHAAVRLSDGSLTNQLNSSSLPYRCVWPDVQDALLTSNNCYSDNGSCENTGLIWNLDAKERPAMEYVNAVNECNFVGASVPSIRDMSEYIHATSKTGSNVWSWTSNIKYWYSSNMGLAGYRWSAMAPDFAFSSPTWGTVLQTSSQYFLRCIGKGTSVGVLPTPSCNGSCFQVDKRRSRLIADSSDRTAADQASAAEACRELGGSLPNGSELVDLIHAGLPNGNNGWLWSSSPVYWYNGGYGYVGFRWSGVGTDEWRPVFSSTTERLPATSSASYRCVWNEALEASPTVCAPGQIQNWDGNQFTCSSSVSGSSGGNANLTEFVDAWGNAWDADQRGATDYATALSVCQSGGGRLPTPTELYRLRANQAVSGVTPIGTASDTAYLWTNIVGSAANAKIGIRVSDGTTTSLGIANSASYRCIWPTTKGNVLAGRSCYAQPSSGCYQADGLRMDDFDRPALPQASASNECAFYGGRLPDQDEFQSLVHSGAHNGSNVWLWLDEPIYWYNNNFGYAIGRWSGIGTNAWAYNSSAGTGSLSNSTTYQAFRCVFSNRMN